MDQLRSLIDNWILIAQGLIGSIGALAFLVAFMYKIIAVDPHSVMEAKRLLATGKNHWLRNRIFHLRGRLLPPPNQQLHTMR